MRKLLKINISFITSNDFRRLCPLQVFVMPTSKHKYQCFLILVQSFSACTFQESIQTFISFVIHIPFKWPRQEAKTKQQQNKTTLTQQEDKTCPVSFNPDWLMENLLCLQKKSAPSVQHFILKSSVCSEKSLTIISVF